MRHLFKNILRNIGKSFWGINFLWHLVAIALTSVIVISDLDWYYFVHTRNIVLNGLLFPGVVLGGFMPLLPLALLIIGYVYQKHNATIVGFALGQSVMLGSIISSFYKTLTGRVQPELFNTTVNVSHSFQFGFWEHGIFWGWPSSHTTIAFAMAIALVTLYPKNRAFVISCVAYALYVGLGVSLSIHWFSEFVAGAIIGWVIGTVVGRSFKADLVE